MVTGNITVTADNNTSFAFKNFTLFSTYKAVINDVFVDDANPTYIAIPLYNLTEYSDNYPDTSKSLWLLKK